LKRLLREPLLHFLLLGGALSVLHGSIAEGLRQASARVVVTAGEIDHLAITFARARQRPPTAPELEELIEARIREEVLYREALAIGLDRDDPVVRRRLQQKVEFLSEDKERSYERLRQRYRVTVRHPGAGGRP
jgi:hypothetical protein